MLPFPLHKSRVYNFALNFAQIQLCKSGLPINLPGVKKSPMPDFVIMTQTSYDKLKADLEIMKTEKRFEVVRQGDLARPAERRYDEPSHRTDDH